MDGIDPAPRSLDRAVGEGQRVIEVLPAIFNIK
jgi:hypothetical protein